MPRKSEEYNRLQSLAKKNSLFIEEAESEDHRTYFNIYSNENNYKIYVSEYIDFESVKRILQKIQQKREKLMTKTRRNKNHECPRKLIVGIPSLSIKESIVCAGRPYYNVTEDEKIVFEHGTFVATRAFIQGYRTCFTKEWRTK